MVGMEPSPISTFAKVFWTSWLSVTVGAFLVYELFSLVTGNPQNTLSNWVWVNLKIRVGESITQWSAGDLLVFCVYISVFVLWLPWHFWWGKFR